MVILSKRRTKDGNEGFSYTVVSDQSIDWLTDWLIDLLILERSHLAGWSYSFRRVDIISLYDGEKKKQLQKTINILCAIDIGITVWRQLLA